MDMNERTKAAPFFFVGSRRSGTTLVCHIINYHPKLYTSFERYIMWMLYSIQLDKVIKAPASGAFAPLLITFKQAGDAFLNYFKSDMGAEATRIAFCDAFYNCRMARGTGKWRENLVAIGEKNPPEYTMPAMQKFILETFPEARFIHVIRHPTPVVRSQVRWHHGIDGSQVKAQRLTNYKLWVKVEQRILDIKALLLTIRYEDLVAEPASEAHRLYEFLGVDSADHEKGPDYIDRRVTNNVLSSGNTKYGDLAVPNGIGGLRKMMARYDYKG